MNNAEVAVSKFKSGYNCAQSVLFSYAKDFNLNEDIALKIANGFGGGMGRKQEVCGAVSAAIMVIGLKYGRCENESKEKQETTYSKVRTFIDEFEKRNGTVKCKELLSGCELLTDAGQKQFKENALIEKCYDYVRQACTHLDEIL